MAIGFLLAGGLMAAPMGKLSGWPTLVAAAAVAVGLPVFDTTLVVLSRRRRGRAGALRGHRPHDPPASRLPQVPAAVCAVLALGQATLCGLAIEATRLGRDATIVLACLLVVARRGADHRRGRIRGGHRSRETPERPALEPARWRRCPQSLRRSLLALAGLGCGASPAFFGYFDMSVWGPIGLALIAIAIGLLVGRPAIPTGLAAVAVAALLLFAAWCLLSTGWAESADRALTEADRWLLNGVFMFVIVLLMEDRRDGEVFVLSFALAALCVAGYDLVKMLGGEGSSLFGGFRLLQPLGYVNGLGGFFLLRLLAARRPRRAGPVGGDSRAGGGRRNPVGRACGADRLARQRLCLCRLCRCPPRPPPGSQAPSLAAAGRAGWPGDRVGAIDRRYPGAAPWPLRAAGSDDRTSGEMEPSRRGARRRRLDLRILACRPRRARLPGADPALDLRLPR